MGSNKSIEKDLKRLNLTSKELEEITAKVKKAKDLSARLVEIHGIKFLWIFKRMNKLEKKLKKKEKQQYKDKKLVEKLLNNQSGKYK